MSYEGTLDDIEDPYNLNSAITSPGFARLAQASLISLELFHIVKRLNTVSASILKDCLPIPTFAVPSPEDPRMSLWHNGQRLFAMEGRCISKFEDILRITAIVYLYVDAVPFEESANCMLVQTVYALYHRLRLLDLCTLSSNVLEAYLWVSMLIGHFLKDDAREWILDFIQNLCGILDLTKWDDVYAILSDFTSAGVRKCAMRTKTLWIGSRRCDGIIRQTNVLRLLKSMWNDSD